MIKFPLVIYTNCQWYEIPNAFVLSGVFSGFFHVAFNYSDYYDDIIYYHFTIFSGRESERFIVEQSHAQCAFLWDLFSDLVRLPEGLKRRAAVMLEHYKI